MGLSFLPGIRVKSVTELTPAVLKEKNIRLLMLDFDNTIVPYTTDTPTAEMESWLQTMIASDIEICVVSNSKRDRVKIFCEKYGIFCITHAKKPSAKGVLEAVAKYGIPKSQCALAGDQIYTDTMAANFAGVTGILVEAIDQHNIWLKLRHVAEMPFVWMSNKRKI